MKIDKDNLDNFVNKFSYEELGKLKIKGKYKILGYTGIILSTPPITIFVIYIDSMVYSTKFFDLPTALFFSTAFTLFNTTVFRRLIKFIEGDKKDES